MFELLSNVQSVPVDKNSLAMVHRGMNKVRVSVGDHSSEPSEVYIITGLYNAELETYIIFYLLQPGIHVVYGYDQNPYSPALKQQVLEEATIFVEEMGSILEEVPWETMTPEQKSAWIEKEILYTEPVIEELEEIDEIEALEEVVDIEDEDAGEENLEENPAIDVLEGVVEISDEEMQQLLSEDGSRESLTESEEHFEETGDTDLEQEDADSVGTTVMDDVVVAEGDFDEMLKQAFLKPDVVEKTRKKANKIIEETVDEQPPSVEPVDDEIDDDEVDDDTQLYGDGESLEVEEDAETGAELEEVETVEMIPSLTEALFETVDAVETIPGTSDATVTRKDAELRVIRFLSRF